MTKVIVAGPIARFERYDIRPPKNFKLIEINRKISDKEFIDLAKDAKFILSGLMGVNKNVIEALENVVLIQSEGVGYDTIDIEAAREKGIYVANADGVNKDSVAEHTIGLILAILRRTPSANRDIKAGKFSESYKGYGSRSMKTLKSLHVGILGLGNIGIELVKRLKPFKCEISYYNHNRKENLEKELGIKYLPQEDLYKNCDIISIHVPLTEETRGMINKDILGLMKEDAYIINTARGEIINQCDLAEALIQNKIAGAALDTLEIEPPPKDDPLLNLPEEVDDRLILTTHIAGITDNDLKGMQKIAWENMERVLRGERPINIVNGL